MFVHSNAFTSLCGLLLISLTRAASDATGCAAIAQYQASAVARASALGTPAISVNLPASVAYDCLTSIPLNATDASAFIDYYRTYLNFQSTLAFLKNPPTSYQQPAVDLLGGLDAIQADVDSGRLKNQYDFETAVLKLVYAAHDGHLSLEFGANNIFLFDPGSDLRLVSVAIDQVHLPQVYIKSDIAALAETQQNLAWTPSPLVSINGENATTWLRQVIQPAVFVEDHAVYNFLFSNYARDVDEGGIADALQNLHVYPGAHFNITFQNGTTKPALFKASYNPKDYNFTTGITGEQVYNRFVKAKPTKTASSSASASASATTAATATPTSLQRLPLPYPQHPVIVQQGLGADLGSPAGLSGYLTGYFVNESSLAVLSVPSFSMDRSCAGSFTTVVGEFLNMSKAAGMQKIIVDLQGNGGGDALLATDLFKHASLPSLFFPQIDSYDGSNLRAHPTMKTLLSIYSNLTLLEDGGVTSYSMAGIEPWVAENYLESNGTEYQDWQQLYGPVHVNGGLFSNVFRNNYSNAVVDEIATAYGIVAYGYANRSTIASAPYAAEDIALVLDGFCTSTCSLFVEKMKTEAGVRSITFGGLPQFGPMQGDAGSRGSQDYQYSNVDSDIKLATELTNKTLKELFPEITVHQCPYQGFSGELNLKDQIRRGEDIPVQFLYEASDCRLFYTPAMIVDYAILWKAAADALWGNGTCVQGSTGQSSAGNVTQTDAIQASTASAMETSGAQSTAPAPYTGMGLRIAPTAFFGLVFGLVALVL